MKKETLEHLSSLMDGEMSRETGLFLTRRMSSDRELGRTWARYHLIRDCIRHPGGELSIADMSLTLDGVIEAETDSTQVGSKAPGWLKPVSGFAIAASVAVVAILAISPGLEPEVDGPAVQPFTSPNTLSSVPISQPASFNGDNRARNQRMNFYLLRHSQVVGTVGRRGFVSFVPIVTTVPVETFAGENENLQEGETAISAEGNPDSANP